MRHVLLVEDEEDIQSVISYNLVRAGYSCAIASSAEEAHQELQKKIPDIILLDIMLPGQNGFSFCSQVKKNQPYQEIPIIIMSARGEDADIIKGLELGADDYIPKPVSPKVLLARIESVLRRVKSPKIPENNQKIVGPFQLDITTHQFYLNHVPVELTLSEFGILELLMTRPGWVYTRNQIMEHIKGESISSTQRSVDVVIVGLRKKLGQYGKSIVASRGIGYRFQEESE